MPRNYPANRLAVQSNLEDLEAILQRTQSLADSICPTIACPHSPYSLCAQVHSARSAISSAIAAMALVNERIEAAEFLAGEGIIS